MRQAFPGPDRYAEAGVDITAGQELVDRIRPLAAATARRGAVGGVGGFGALFDLAACGFRDPLLVSTTDGVGTKLLLARETGRLRHIGIDLVAMCVNDLVVQGAEPLFFLDYYATGRLEVAEAAEVVTGIAEACRDSGCALVGGETAEMPGLYAPGHFDLAGFAVGAVERAALLPRSDVRPGDAILGLASSGPHSNGYSLIRMIVSEQRLDLAAPAPFQHQVTLADALMVPTRLYVRPCLAALRAAPGAIRAMAHITGGGLLENLPRVLPQDLTAVVDASSWPLPPVFRWLKEAGQLSDTELARTLNGGIGMALIAAEAEAEAVAGSLEDSGQTVYRIGRIEPGRGPPRVTIANADRAWAVAPPS